MFSKKPEPNSPLAARRPTRTAPGKGPSSGATFSVIGADVTIRGDVEASADLHVDGIVEGDLTCTALVQGRDSRIEGAVRAENARIAGTVKGSLATRELIVLAGARIEGDVSYETLSIEQGAEVDGRLQPKATEAEAVMPVAKKGAADDERKLSLAS